LALDADIEDMSKDFQDYYALLEVDATATASQLKGAWKRLARENHPDRNPQDPLATERFKTLHLAWRTLSDPLLKSRYDRLYARRKRPSVFWRSRSRTRGARQPEPTRRDPKKGTTPFRPKPQAQAGLDVHHRVTLSFAELKRSCRLSLQLPHLARALEVSLPADKWPLQRFILRGKGLPGQFGGRAGRLILELHPQLSKAWSLKRRELSCRIHLKISEQLLGSQRQILLPDGRALQLLLPPSARVGQCLRLPKRGLQDIEGYGDLLLHLDGLPLPEILLRPTQQLRSLLRRIRSKVSKG
jgi:DnaJ-class molecular chaperone